jgi:uncharacterized membrane protein
LLLFFFLSLPIVLFLGKIFEKGRVHYEQIFKSFIFHSGFFCFFIFRTYEDENFSGLIFFLIHPNFYFSLGLFKTIVLEIEGRIYEFLCFQTLNFSQEGLNFLLVCLFTLGFFKMPVVLLILLQTQRQISFSDLKFADFPGIEFTDAFISEFFDFFFKIGEDGVFDTNDL